jgi:hypothetical protein
MPSDDGLSSAITDSARMVGTQDTLALWQDVPHNGPRQQFGLQQAAERIHC